MCTSFRQPSGRGADGSWCEFGPQGVIAVERGQDQQLGTFRQALVTVCESQDDIADRLLCHAFTRLIHNASLCVIRRATASR